MEDELREMVERLRAIAARHPRFGALDNVADDLVETLEEIEADECESDS